MSKEYFYSRNICCSEITEHPDHYLAKFVICDFSVNGNQVALNRDTIESWMSTLVGNPLVGKLVVAPKGELDFSGHNMKVVTRKDDDGIEWDDRMKINQSVLRVHLFQKYKLKRLCS